MCAYIPPHLRKNNQQKPASNTSSLVFSSGNDEKPKLYVPPCFKDKPRPPPREEPEDDYEPQYQQRPRYNNNNNYHRNNNNNFNNSMQISKLERELSELRSQLEHEQSENAKLQQRIEKLTVDADYQKCQELLATKTKEFYQQCKSLSDSNKSLQEQLHQFQIKDTQHDEEMKKINKELDVCKQSRDYYKQQSEKLKSSVAELNETVKFLRSKQNPEPAPAPEPVSEPVQNKELISADWDNIKTCLGFFVNLSKNDMKTLKKSFPIDLNIPAIKLTLDIVNKTCP